MKLIFIVKCKIYIQIQIFYFMMYGSFKNLFLFNYMKITIDIILAGKKTYSKLPSIIHVIFIFLTIIYLFISSMINEIKVSGN
jgi:hypothetical protein